MMETEILKFICANQGSVNTDYLLFNLGSGDSLNLSEIISNGNKFVTCCPFGQPKVVARTRLRLCRAKECPGTCRGFHMCKNFLFSGSCQFSLTRRGCSFSHALDSEHNQGILREHELDSLSRTELCTLLLQSDNRILPQICYDYNNGDGVFGRCQDGNSCQRLHICEKYLNRDCNCSRTHEFTAPQPLKSLKDRGVPDDLIHSLKSVYANIQALKYSGNRGDRGNTDNRPQRGGNCGNRGNRGSRGNRGNRNQTPQAISSSNIVAGFDGLDLYSEDGLGGISSTAANDADLNTAPTAVRGRGVNRGNRGNSGNRGNHQQPRRARSTQDISSAVNDDASSDNGQNRRERRRPVRDKTEICMYFIKGFCKHEERCFKAHDKMPYRWEVQENDQWIHMPDNEMIEKDYCDPKNTYSSSSSPQVHFDMWTCGSNSVRRLSTINSLTEPDFIHTTEWLWYWEDESGKWNVYASTDGAHTPADMDSSKLEQKFLDNDKDVVDFTAGSQSYSLSFQDMIQTNKKYGTKRVVRRRPRFVSAVEVRTRKTRRPDGRTAIPDHWDKTQVHQTEYRRVSLQTSSDEYKEVDALFCKTMRGFTIIKVERIQNRALWETYQLQKTQMKNKNNGRDVTEKKLFHGTDNHLVDTICQHNFDWRLCGTHGTAYGKGSYFARDAKYSHSYTGDSDVRSMFVSRLLVGHYTKGSPDYLRPPSKDGGDINYFDSCVDDVINPSIYVLFERHQIYPEYLLQYRSTNPFVNYYGASSVSGVRPAPAPKPKPVPRPAPKPSVSVYPSSASSYQTSASVYPSSASSYQTSASVYPSSASSYQPRTLSYQPSTATYQYQRTQSSPPSPPTPREKNQSDSCVIV